MMKRSIHIPVSLLKIISKYFNISYLHVYINFFEKDLDSCQGNTVPQLDWFCLSKNENIPVCFFEKYIDKVNLKCLSGNENIPVSFFEKYLQRPSEMAPNDLLDWSGLSGNTN